MKRLFLVVLAVVLLTGFVALPDEELKKTEETSKAYLGIISKTISEKLAEKYEIPIDQGIYIASVSQGSPADDAGLKRRDILTHINSKSVKVFEDLKKIIDSKKPGDTIEVRLIRKGVEQTLVVTLGERKGRNTAVWYSNNLKNKYEPNDRRKSGTIFILL